MAVEWHCKAISLESIFNFTNRRLLPVSFFGLHSQQKTICIFLSSLLSPGPASLAVPFSERCHLCTAETSWSHCFYFSKIIVSSLIHFKIQFEKAFVPVIYSSRSPYAIVICISFVTPNISAWCACTSNTGWKLKSPETSVCTASYFLSVSIGLSCSFSSLTTISSLYCPTKVPSLQTPVPLKALPSGTAFLNLPAFLSCCIFYNLVRKQLFPLVWAS